MGTSVSELELWFFYYLIDGNDDVSGVLTVNRYLDGDIRYRGNLLRQVTEVEHDTMVAFGLPKHVHDAKAFPFFEDIHGQAIDSRA
jgi:hypothetical protein